MDFTVVINKSQILTLFVCISFPHGHRSNKPKLAPLFKRYLSVQVSTDRGAAPGLVNLHRGQAPQHVGEIVAMWRYARIAPGSFAEAQGDGISGASAVSG